jgi:hypothetical protein
VLVLLVLPLFACAVEGADADADAVACDGKCDGGDGGRMLWPTDSYEDRLYMLERVADAHPMPAGWPDPRDGLRVQTRWQLDSGRAALGTTGRAYGWWQNVNWTLTVWQFQALQQRGEFKDVKVNTWKNYAVPPDVTAAALALSDAIDRARAGIGVNDVGAAQAELQRRFWTFHETARAVGLPRNAALLDALPDGEREFSRAFSGLVHIAAAVNLPSSESVMVTLNRLLLPARVLSAQDITLTGPSSLPVTHRLAVAALIGIEEFEQASGGLILTTLSAFVTTQARATALVDVLAKALQADDPIGVLLSAAG